MPTAKTDSLRAHPVRVQRALTICQGRVMPAQLPEVGDDDVGAGRAQIRGRYVARDADHEPERAGAAGGDAGERVLDHDRAGGRDAEAGGGLEKAVGGGLARRPGAWRSWPSTVSLEEGVDAGGAQDLAPLALEDTRR